MASDNFTRFVRAVVREDHLCASVVIEPGLDPAELDGAILESLLAQRGVCGAAIISGAIGAAVDEYRADPTGRVEKVVAEGTAPEHGRDAEFSVAPGLDQHTGADSGAGADPGRIDHHARSALTVVREGQEIGRVTRQTCGSDGIDVGGRTLAARPGRALRAVMDESVRLCEDGRVVALQPGLLEVSETRVRVVRELELAGFVDFSTGNVEFPGDVTVAKGVRDCFVVHAGRDLRVKGLVEAAELAAGHDVFLSTGMAAREKGKLRAGHDLHANYLTNLEASVGHDVVVAKEIANCRLVASGKLASPMCAVVGGSTCVAMRADIAQLGSESAAPTEFIVGKLPELEARISDLLAMRRQTTQQAERAATRLKELHGAMGKLTASQAEELTELEFALSTARARDAKVAGAIERLAGFLLERTEAVLIVHRAIHPGVRLWIGAYEVEVRELIKGPIEISLGPVAGAPRGCIPASRAEVSLTKLARVVHQLRFADLRKYAPQAESRAA